MNMSTQRRQQARETLSRNPGLCEAVSELITSDLEDLHEQMESLEDVTHLMRAQGGIMALRQILRVITPRDAGK